MKENPQRQNAFPSGITEEDYLNSYELAVSWVIFLDKKLREKLADPDEDKEGGDSTSEEKQLTDPDEEDEDSELAEIPF